MKKSYTAMMLALLMLLVPAFSAYAEGTVIIGQQESEQSTLGGETELKVGQVEKVSDAYSIEYKETRWFTDEKLQAGWYFFYLTSQENGAPRVRYEHPVGTTTPVCMYFTYTNRSKQNVNVLKCVKAQLVFDDHYVFETMPLQLNPDQVAADGEPCSSSSAVDIEPLVSVRLEFLTHVPFIVRDSDKPLVLYLTIDDSDVYAIDIRNTALFWE